MAIMTTEKKPPEEMTDRELLIETLTLLREHDQVLSEFKPMLKLVKKTNGGTIGVARAIRQGRR